MGDEPGEGAEILNLYFETISKNLDQLEVAVNSSDRSQIELIAHNCAGTSATCGMTAVADPLRELEIATRGGNLANAKRTLAQAKHEFARLQTFLNEHLGQPVAQPA